MLSWARVLFSQRRNLFSEFQRGQGGRIGTFLRPMRLGSFLLIIFFASLAQAQRGDRGGEVQKPVVPPEKIPPAPVLSPQQAVKSFKLPPGFRLELVASEPLVQDPVQIVFDPDGRIWVVEMRGFMPNLAGTGEDQPVGDVVILEDT